MARERLRVSVTYDLVTEALVQDGDTADNGYIDPATERRRSFSNGRKRDLDRTHRLARAGKFDFPSLRAALAYVSGRNCAAHETCWTGDESCMSIYATGEYEGCDVEHFRGSRVLSANYALHIEGASLGTLERLARVLAHQPHERVYFANRRDLQARKPSNFEAWRNQYVG